MRIGNLFMGMALLLILCGVGSVPGAEAGPTPQTSPIDRKRTPITLVDSQPRTTNIVGTVKIKGDVPRRKKIQMEGDPKCAALHEEATLTDEIVADPEGKVRWAFVYVKSGLDERKFGAPKEPVLLDQKGCRYEPHVLGIMVGQDLLVRNSDDLLHNVHALPFTNREFNFGQPTKGLQEKMQFNAPEVMIKVKCEIHPWMGAWIGVLPHPFYAVTDSSGRFAIKGLPPGTYTIEVWHEKYKSVTHSLALKEGDGKESDFELVELKE